LPLDTKSWLVLYISEKRHFFVELSKTNAMLTIFIVKNEWMKTNLWLLLSHFNWIAFERHIFIV